MRRLGLALVALSLCFGPRVVDAKSMHEVHTVVIEGMKMNPAEMNVSAGDTVVWENRDMFPHTVTSDNKDFNSAAIGAGKSWHHVFRKKGQFSYGCTFHPTMKGTLTVK